MNHNEIGRDAVDRPLSLSLFLLLVLFATPSATAGLYVVDVDLPPQNPVHNVVVTYTLPAGVIYRTGSFSVTGAATSVPQEVVSAPNDGSVPVTINWTFESVYNSANLDIVVQFDGIVANVASNRNGVQLPPGTVSYTYDGIPGAKTGRSQPTNIVEPNLKIEKRRINQIGNQIDYELSVYHTTESRSDASDVVVTDVVPQTNRYKPSSIIIFSGPLGTANDISQPVLTWSFNKIDRTWNSSNKVRLRYSIFDNQQGTASPTPRTLNWTSAEGTGYGQDRLYSLVYKEEFLTVSISCNAKSVSAGKVVTYTYTVKNVAFGTTITGITLVDGRLGPITLNATSLGFGASATGTKSYTVLGTDPNPLVNTATATGTYSGTIVTAVGSISVPFGIDPLKVTKTARNKTVARGGNVTYDIVINNDGNVDSTDVVVRDVFNKPVEILYANPPPDEDGLWRFDLIEAGHYQNITLTVMVPERQDFNFSSESGVAGEGFVNVADYYTTTLDPYPLKNCVYVTFFNSTFNDGTGRYETVTDCETVTVLGEAGTELSAREHGSGTYESSDTLEIQTETDRISFEKDMSAAHATTTLGLYNNRTVTYSSKWTEAASAKNRATGASMSESYRRASTIDRETRMLLDENESLMEFDTQFDGMGHISFLKMPTNNTTFKATPLFESREDYSGSFHIIENVDEYGSAASSEKSASGEGLVNVDKRVDDVQRSYEQGTGSYSSEELIETYTNYIAKEISLVYAPAEGSSLKWKEGMYSQTPETSYIGEEYTGIIKLDKETVARGLNEMETEANFSGRARYRTIYYEASTAGSENTSTNESENASTIVSANSLVEPAIDFDEIYEGDYSIARRILISGAPRYDRPHLNVTKSLEGIEEETAPWGHNEAHLAGETKTRKVATYTIKIENDGNRVVGPVRVKDLFPPKAGYVGSSLRPTELTGAGCNWTLTHLAIGDFAAIEIKLDVTYCTGSELVNRVIVCGGDGGSLICASNFTAQEVDWLSMSSTDGPTVQPGYAESVIDAGEVEDGYDSCTGWNLPGWDFERAGSRAGLACDELTIDEESFWLGT